MAPSRNVVVALCGRTSRQKRWALNVPDNTAVAPATQVAYTSANWPAMWNDCG